LTTQKTKIDSLKNDYITDQSDIIGMQAKKYISMGNMFKLSDVSRPSVIKQNDPVSIIYSSGTINLKTVGVAMGAGAVGDMIKVKNSTSGAMLLAQVTNKNTVQVGVRE